MAEHRLRRLREKMDQEGVDAFLVKKPANIRYLCGFTSGEDAWLLLDAEHQTLLSDGRYRSQASIECPDCAYVEYKRDPLDRLRTFSIKYKKLAIEADYLSYRDYVNLETALAARLTPTERWVEDLRVVKDEAECALLRQAAAVSSGVFSALLSWIEPGMAERDVAVMLEYMVRQNGAETMSFPSIVAAGANAALPHGKPGSYRLRPGDMVTMDWGGTVAGYVSDMTRTIVIGAASTQLRDHYERLLEAQLIGLEAVREGVRAEDIDAKVRQALKRHSLDQYFVHSTGHGIGLDIHEQPSLTPRSAVVLQRNMVVTVEPGIYIPGYGGVRIEDSVIVTAEGGEVITPLVKTLTII